MSKLTLYFMNGACSLAARILINELKIDADFSRVDKVTRKIDDGTDFVKINKKNCVPAIKLPSGDILTEGAAILQYLADNYNGAHLFPTGKNLDRYRVVEWFNYVSTDVHKSFGPFFNPNISQELKTGIFTEILISKIKFLDDHFGVNKYLTGGNISIADIYLFVCLSWHKYVNLDISVYKNLSRFFDDVGNRDSVKLSLKQENLV